MASSMYLTPINLKIWNLTEFLWQKFFLLLSLLWILLLSGTSFKDCTWYYESSSFFFYRKYYKYTLWIIHLVTKIGNNSKRFWKSAVFQTYIKNKSQLMYLNKIKKASKFFSVSIKQSILNQTNSNLQSFRKLFFLIADILLIL